MDAVVQILKTPVFALLISVWFCSPTLRAEPATHTFDDAAKGEATKVEDSLALTRQEAMVKAMRSMDIARFPLERIARLMEDRPNATPEQFNRVLDLASEAMPGALTAEQKSKLKKLYLEELGQVKTAPGAEFVSAAKLLAAKLPVKQQPLNPPANPNVPQDPKNAVSTLNGATTLGTPPTPNRGAGDSLGELSKGDALKQLEAKMATIQAGLAAQQQASAQALAGQGPGGQAQAGQGGSRGLLDNLLGLLRGDKKEGGGRERGGRGEGKDRGGREHSPQGGGPGSQASNESEKVSKPQPPEKQDRERERRGGGGGGQLAQQNSGGGSSDKDKKEGDKDKKAEPIIQAGELSKEKKEKPKEEKPKEEKPETKEPANDDALANAQNLLLGKPKQKRSLGPGKVGEPIARPQSGGGGGVPEDPSGGGGGGAPGPTVGAGGGGGGGGGGDFGGGPPMVGGGDEPAGPAQSFNFVKMTDFQGSSGGGSDDAGPSTVDGGGYDEPVASVRRGGVLPGSEPLRLMPHTGTGRGWILDYVGHWKKHICEGADKVKPAVCFRVPKPSMALSVKAAMRD